MGEMSTTEKAGTKRTKQLVYISHPSGGKPENTEKIANIVRKLYADDELFKQYCFVSPVHCYGFMYSEYESDYIKGLTFCTDLLEHCDIMLLCGDWKNSRGCTHEREICIEKNIPFVEVPDDKALNKIIESHSII